MRRLQRRSSRRSRGPPNDRENELFREASSLCAATGAQVAVFTINGEGQTRAYGCPSVDAVLGRYLAHPQPPTPAARFKAAVDELLRRHIERKREEERAAMEGETPSGRELKEMEWSIEFLEGVKARVARRIQSLEARGSEPSTSGSAE
ncbi:uncharacterized protein LOC120112777 [Phoenix dactylifera]|uniref:Uncharacterized protein LOC120112777 n=1 Tax=Phoenix dactylifera TaxID=42345 RepID=A0A8B9AQ92_PHODC|nr:uncharacterized protein LOC120112777 [Phoenix dactylifera]